jgi:hypothetical protein
MLLRVKVSRWINYHIFNGKCNQMLSSRVYVSHNVCAIYIIDSIFFWQEEHCKQAFYYDLVNGGFCV